MNWYKKSQLRGEWWIMGGQAIFADAEVGDYNHSGVVIETILDNHELPDTTDMEDLKKEGLQSLLKRGFSQDEIDVILEKVDARDYGMKNLGWKRVHGNNVQTQTLTTSDLQDISNGLFEIDDNISAEQMINIEVVGNRVLYKNVPYSVVEKNDPSQLIQYGSRY